MNISLCITTFNEEKSINRLIESLLNQTRLPDELIIVDGGSTDKTLEAISSFQFPFSSKIIKLKNCKRAKGRNIGIRAAKNEIIAITDAGCVAHKDWLEKITEPFKNESVDISAGYYKMVGKTPMQKAMAVFLGVTPKKFGKNFLPSTRSMAFRKSAWKKVGGFPEGRENSAEDTDFNYLAVRLSLKYARVKTAIVEWGMPNSIQEFRFKIYEYAKWDARYGTWWNPVQRFASHNIKASLILLRYIIATIFFLYCLFVSPPLFAYWIICLFAYLYWSFRKVKNAYKDNKVAVYGPVLQIASDLAVICGFVSGIINR
jgi:glycosyltransferase involved in cell wall biosynthesis